MAIGIPSRAPPKASTMLSVSIWRTTRMRLAPSAARRAISGCVCWPVPAAGWRRSDRQSAAPLRRRQQNHQPRRDYCPPDVPVPVTTATAGKLLVGIRILRRQVAGNQVHLFLRLIEDTSGFSLATTCRIMSAALGPWQPASLLDLWFPLPGANVRHSLGGSLSRGKANPAGITPTTV